MDERGFAMPPYGVAADPTPGTRRAPVLGSEIWRSSASACPRLGTCPSATDPADTANCSHFRRETGGRLDGLWSCANCSHTEAAGPIRMRLLRGVSVSGIGRSILFELLLFSLKQMVLDPIQPAQEEQVHRLEHFHQTLVSHRTPDCPASEEAGRTLDHAPTAELSASRLCAVPFLQPVEGHVVLSLDMFQLDAEIDTGIFKWRRKDEHQLVRAGKIDSSRLESKKRMARDEAQPPAARASADAPALELVFAYSSAVVDNNNRARHDNKSTPQYCGNLVQGIAVLVARGDGEKETFSCSDVSALVEKEGVVNATLLQGILAALLALALHNVDRNGSAGSSTQLHADLFNPISGTRHLPAPDIMALDMVNMATDTRGGGWAMSCGEINIKYEGSVAFSCFLGSVTADVSGCGPAACNDSQRLTASALGAGADRTLESQDFLRRPHSFANASVSCQVYTADATSCGPGGFEALAKLPEPCKPESLGMDILHSILAVQPEEHALDEDPCNPEANLIATEGKQSPLDSRSSTCMPPMFEKIVDCDDGNAGTDSRHSFFSRSWADDADHSRPPNRLQQDQHNSRMEGFLKSVSASSRDLEKKVRLFRLGPADVPAARMSWLWRRC
ncbi:hypothetical protein AK812_SmicGene9132 [Symbiodinium microadriaticum]|uniref:Uncharacterized protein n=1 Tax=Symbiodinium microadriaticum TaxID=2951 RepID=A0A1Q9EJ65_SYMMI|nr:hypothetical protein AK812_SmicGene9132 [Symbiodinium microadriaticum]